MNVDSSRWVNSMRQRIVTPHPGHFTESCAPIQYRSPGMPPTAKSSPNVNHEKPLLNLALSKVCPQFGHATDNGFTLDVSLWQTGHLSGLLLLSQYMIPGIITRRESRTKIVIEKIFTDLNCSPQDGHFTETPSLRSIFFPHPGHFLNTSVRMKYATPGQIANANSSISSGFESPLSNLVNSLWQCGHIKPILLKVRHSPYLIFGGVKA